MVNPNIDKLLEQKRKKFTQVVLRACKRRKFPIPHINFEGCENEDENQLAHYHPNLNKICISKIQLIKLNYGDIEEVATHEVTHIIEQNHDSSFYEEDENTKIATWRPPGGVAQNTPEINKRIKRIDEKYANEKELKIDKTCCNYCGEKRKLTKCKHCGKYFCKEHIKPCLPGGYSPEGGRYKALINQISTEDSKNTHPCPDFYDYEKKRKEEEDKRYREALERALSKEKYPVKEEIYPTEITKPEIITDRPVMPDEKEEQPTDITEVSNKAIHSKIIHIGKKSLHLWGMEHFDGTGWYSWTYFFKTKKEAEWVFDTAKKKNSNIIEDKEDDKNLTKIQLRKSSKIPSVTFIYKKPPKENGTNFDKVWVIVIIALILGIAFLYYYNQYALEEEITLTEVEIQQPLFKEIPIEISFTEYLNNIENYDNKAVTLTGFLSREIEKLGAGGVYTEYIIDDFDNKITLLNLNKEQINLFPKKGKTTDLYNVTGKFKRKYQSLDFEVVNIVKTERPVNLIERK
jgi:hypothetical protein